MPDLRALGRVVIVGLMAAVLSPVAGSEDRPRARDLGLEPGVLQPGPLNAITDVAGVRVGQQTLVEGTSVRTGVTAVVPHEGNVFQSKVPAAVWPANAFGKAAGFLQVQELGNLETPIVLTNTLCVGTAVQAVVDWTLQQPGNEEVRSVNAVVGETNDAVSPLFLATVEVVEEAVLNSLFRATTVTGRDGHTREAFPIEVVEQMIRSEEETVRQEEHDRRIDYIELPTTDIEAAKAFYTAVFGWTTQDWGPDYSSFADGRLNGGFRKEAEVVRGGLLVVLYAVDLEAVEVAVRGHGGTIIKEIFTFPGGRRFHFTDPSGNELAVWSDT